MTVIDPTTALGQCRLRCADFSDLPLLPDSVYTQALVESNNNVPNASKVCASYILGILSMKVDRRMGLQLEVKNSQAFKAYKEFLLLTIKDPAFITLYPVPYSSEETNGNVIANFISDWSRNYYSGTESQALALSADRSPNDGSRYGFGGLV